MNQNPIISIEPETPDVSIEIKVSNEGEPGYTPQRGIDYWTDADKREIVDCVKQEIGELPGGGTVKSVNGKKPDKNGNVVVDPELPSAWDIPSADPLDTMPYDKVLSTEFGDDGEPKWVLQKPPSAEAVRYTTQTLNANQQAQARKNIGAQPVGEYASREDVDKLSEEIALYDAELDIQLKSGRNLNVTPYDATFTNNGVTFTTNADNSITVRGTPTGDNFWPDIKAATEKRWRLPAGIYTLTGGAQATCTVVLCLFDSQTSQTQFGTHAQGQNDAAPIVVTVENDCWAIIRCTVTSKWPGGEAVLRPQLEAGDTATEYVSPWEGELYSKRLADIETAVGRLDATVNALAVPDYYMSTGYLFDKVARINELARGCAGNGDAWVFITDMHWIQNAKKSPALLKYIHDNTHVNRLFGGGDYCHNSSYDNNYFEVASILRDAWAGSRYYTFGNHEYMGLANGVATTDANLNYAFNAYGTERVGDMSRNYYYVDNTQQKMRYIVLNHYAPNTTTPGAADETPPEPAQRTWLENVALDVDTDWTVVVIIHNLYHFAVENGGYNATVSNTHTAAKAVVDLLDAFVEGGGTVACVLCGEYHFDMINRTAKGIPIITTTCDKNTSGGETALPITDQWAARPSGTVNEQAFDVMVLDKTNRTITAVRIGYPARNSLEGAYGELVEERVVTY